MLKFLRKYNKIILVIGGALLMVAFLMPQAIQQLGQDRSRAEYMRIDGKKITEAQAAESGRRLYMLRQMVPSVLMRLGIEPDRTEHWLMLTHEAARHGLIGGHQDGRDFITDLAELLAYESVQMRMQQLGQFYSQAQAQQDLTTFQAQIALGLETARVQSDLRPEEFDLAMAELHGVARLRSLFDNGPARVSDRRAIQEGLRLLNTASVDYVFVPAEQAIDQIPEPSDEVLAAHLERFRDLRPSEGEFGIGYNLPARVKLEWLTLDREAIGSGVRVDRVELAQRYLARNPGAMTSGPEYEAARAQLEQEIRRETIDKIMSEADKAIRAEFARATRRLEVQGEYRVLPANWDEVRPDLQKVRDVVVERVKSQTGRTIPAPSVTVMNSAWHTGEELVMLPGIGRSFIQRGSRRFGFAETALSVKELGDPLGTGLQVGVPGGMSIDGMGNQYYFTVLAAKPESAPESVDEVRDRLVREYRRLEAFKILQREAEVYQQRAINEGLASLVPTGDAISTEPGTPIMRRGANVNRANQLPFHGELNSEKVKDAVLAAAERLDPTVDASTIDASQRIVAIPAPGELGLVVAQIQSYRPMTVEQYRTMDNRLVQQLIFDGQDDAQAEMSRDPLSLDNLAERLNAKLPARRTDAES